ncbi:hypothetical protein AB0I84_07375 [Streptomyces spectabilis]|uniref:hypothetical protein n=1 Tax=Streptomyces spectabilis TaxID=68270 RepID=UPI0033D322A3
MFVYVIPAGFLPPIERGTARVDQLDDGRWNACAACAEIIDRRDIPALVKRVVVELTAFGTPGLHDREGRRFFSRALTQSYRAVLSYPLTKENLT